jgi:transcription-repair coupling factor (superfamily II helicase)
LTEEGFARGAEPRFLRGSLNEGFRADNRPAGSEADAVIPATFLLAPDARGLVVVTETEVLGRQRARRAAPDSRAMVQRAQVDQLLDFSELVEGDPIVHLQHGIAIFRGLARLDTAQGMREVISLEFDGGVTLHVPLSESHLLSRYVGLSKTRPQLGKIGSGRWEKARQAAERATLDLAAELLRIQAHREAQPGRAFAEDNAWQKEFSRNST